MKEGFVKSSFSGANSCVELQNNTDSERIVMSGGVFDVEGNIRYTPEEWRVFLLGVAAGELEFGVLSHPDVVIPDKAE